MKGRIERFTILDPFAEIAVKKGFAQAVCLAATAIVLNSDDKQKTVQEITGIARNSNSEDDFLYAIMKKYD